MKTLYMIGGTMGVGKTSVCQILKTKLTDCVFLDGDWCWDANPFQVNDETKAMVHKNICFLLNQFIHCSAYKNIIFCWVMHEQAIIDGILDELDKNDCRIKSISLLCNEQVLRNRLLGDVQKGIRQEDVIERSIERIPLYQTLSTEKIDTSEKTLDQIVEEILLL
ncbi:MAG: AAA family ATPase [Oscillospiraceae bacterium]|nr:AAA family ATPase [Oscillospiraceae bacterium]